jgi:hypothetical protein
MKRQSAQAVDPLDFGIRAIRDRDRSLHLFNGSEDFDHARFLDWLLEAGTTADLTEAD